jgi:hypothetical protein
VHALSRCAGAQAVRRDTERVKSRWPTRPRAGLFDARAQVDALVARVEPFAQGTRFEKARLWRVEIAFGVPVEGPLLLGDGRFLWLGLMAPARDVVPGTHAFAIADGLAGRPEPLDVARALRRAVMARVQATSAGVSGLHRSSAVMRRTALRFGALVLRTSRSPMSRTRAGCSSSLPTSSSDACRRLRNSTTSAPLMSLCRASKSNDPGADFVAALRRSRSGVTSLIGLVVALGLCS